jgi:phosphatidylserine/phosphatidylglycerophosphate/cardiolipin synthase-like enzyme
MYQIIKSPWEKIFVNQLKNARKDVYLASPFIKSPTASLISQNINRGTDFRYINSFKLAHFNNGASDLDALSIFNDNKCRQKNVPNLHAKLFIFDETAIITSGNLTPSGLKNNLEYGILVQDSLVSEIKHDYLSIFNNPDYPKITADIIDKAKEILLAIPKEKKKKISVSDKSLFKDIVKNTEREEIFDGGVDAILANLSPWERDVFECLLKIRDDVFTLQEVYSYENQLSKFHPHNRNVQAKIRQQLQYLRDIGLIEFIRPGVYKKLWV